MICALVGPKSLHHSCGATLSLRNASSVSAGEMDRLEAKQREVHLLVLRLLQQKAYNTYSQSLDTAAAAVAPSHTSPVVKQLNLTREYERARPPATNEQVQNWIDQISTQKPDSAQLATERHWLKDWDVYLIGQQDSQMVYGYAAELQTSRVLVLRNYGTAIDLDSMSMGCSSNRDQDSAVGEPMRQCACSPSLSMVAKSAGVHILLVELAAYSIDPPKAASSLTLCVGVQACLAKA